MINQSLFSSCTSWSDFVNELEQLSKKEKGDAFESLTKLYFKLSPKYEFYEDVWFLAETPSNVLEELGLPNHDLGIDLIAKNGDEYHAIQCKYHSDRNQSVTFKEVATFISLLESNSKITQGYICSSADLTSRNFQKLNTKPINLILSDAWEDLDSEFFENIHAFLTNKTIDLVPFKPREHQVKALNEAKTYFDVEGNSRGKLIFPCGAGKSLTGFWMTQELNSKATLIAVPSLSLVKQTLEVYLREIVANHKKVKWLCICSDEGIGQNEDVVFYTENLGVPCQTDPCYIEKWLKENALEEIIIFTTYQSGRLIAEVSKKLNFKFDIGIFDEAHKTVGSDKKLFSHLLFEENIAIQKRIFMTATERFYKGSKDDIISMDDDTIYGDTFTKMSFKEAIELGLLSDYKVITIDVQKSEIANFIKENNLVQLNDKWSKETEARSLASMLALRKAMKQFPIKNAVSFHSSIEKATRNKELQSYITDSFDFEPIATFTVSGKQPTTKRNAIVNEFAKSNKALITNAKCLTEGVDVPNIDCIVFADPRKSKVDIVQALGRALRKKEGKEWGYVILPVIYDDITHEIDNENFEEILAIVRGLASNDERIIEYFKDKSDKLNTTKKRDKQFNFDVFSEFINENELSEQLQIRLWDKLSRFNWMSFEEAREFVKSLNIKSYIKWQEYCNSGEKPKDIPSAPHSTYFNDGWISWDDFLGHGNKATQKLKFKNFNDARDYVRGLGLAGKSDWENYRKDGRLPKDIPSTPSRTYKGKGWKGFGDWLGNGNTATNKRIYKSFNEAKDYVRKLGINNYLEWIQYVNENKLRTDIPSNPNLVYKNDGWVGYGDFLGNGVIGSRNRIFVSFNEAKSILKDLKMRSQKDWVNFCKKGFRPSNIPSNPQKHYSNEWKGWMDFLGYKKENRFVNYIEAKYFVQSLGIKTSRDWEDYCRINDIPKNIPKRFDQTYKNKGWKGWADFLGKE
jgi:superfamily II DNA or RNA helicase